jgi:hypothetical protein
MLLVAQLPELDGIQHWILPVRGARGLDIDHGAGLLYVACDDGGLVEVNAVTGGSSQTLAPQQNSRCDFF